MPDRSVAADPASGSGHVSGHGSIAHRDDIDGLRAFAILPILLLHCGVTGLRGGFIGVDIFFVISGYLITAIVTRELDAGAFTLAGFYRRRIVRILPALIAMAIITVAVGCFVLMPVTLRDLAQSAVSTAVFSSNIYFYATSDYFAQASELKPLIHTWSLAVEEQFYLLFPLLLIALRHRSRQARIAVLAGLAILSFAIGGWQAATAPSAGFYLLPARIWELMAGGLVALGAYPRIASRTLRNVLCWAALAGIVLCCMFTGPARPFPVPFALPPVMGTALLLAYAPGTSAAAFLALRPLRVIGLLSYSLYLWHRPIIAFALTGRAATMTPLDTVFLLAASFAAAILSYLLVERPALRRWRKGTGLRPHAAALAALVALGLVSLVVAAQAERIRPLPANAARVAAYLGFEASPGGRRQFSTDRCFVIPTGEDYDPACLALAPGRDNVVLVGDSHAAQLSAALRARIAPHRLVQATAAGCRPRLIGPGLRRCRDLVETVYHRTDLSRVSTIILAGRWYDDDAQPLAETVRFLRAKGVAVVVVGPTVEYDADMPDVLARAMVAGDATRIDKLRLAERPVLDRKLGPIVGAAGGRYVSQIALECPEGRCRLLAPDGAPMHIDRSHLSPAAANAVAGAIVSVMNPGAAR